MAKESSVAVAQLENASAFLIVLIYSLTLPESPAVFLVISLLSMQIPQLRLALLIYCATIPH